MCVYVCIVCDSILEMYKSSAPKNFKCNCVIVSSVVVCVLVSCTSYIHLIPIAFMFIKITFMQEKKTEKSSQNVEFSSITGAYSNMSIV